ncbi:MAG TPA: protein kinase [Dehalococcoidia bacterium]|nr:protein kinase [Dehalococcoidia bacterium]
MAIADGTNFGSYRIDGELGEGGMATVYRAHQPSLRRTVAIKVIGAHLAGQMDFQARFRREAEVLARLEHPNILPVYDFGEQDGQAYIVYRYVGGGTLRDRLKGPLPLEAVERLLVPVADALDFAHSQGVVHRDIKPTNILLTEQDVPIVADFGLARLLEAGTAAPGRDLTTQLTQAGMGLGTPSYMAPEQAQGSNVDGRADQYALGIVAYQMLTGSVPFIAETPLAVALKHVTEPLPSPRSRNADLSEAIEQALLRALAKDPGDRFADCRTFLRALGGQGTPRAALPSTSVAVAAADDATPTATFVALPAEQAVSRGATPPTVATATGALAPAGARSERTGELAPAAQTVKVAAAARRGRRLSLIGGLAAVLVLAGGLAGYRLSHSVRPALAAPQGIAVDRQGNRYLADTGHERILRVEPGGKVTRLAGAGVIGDADGMGTGARFNTPEAIAVDAAGNLYVADTDNNRIRKIAPDGTVLTLGDAAAAGPAALHHPEHVAVDAAGNVYVTDRDDNRIRRIAPDGAVTVFAGSGDAGYADGVGAAAQFNKPEGLAVDGAGNLYVADLRNNRIRKIAPDGTVSTFAGSGAEGRLDRKGTESQFSSPQSLTSDAVGNLYVADNLGYVVRKIAPDGTVSTLIDAAHLHVGLQALAVDADGNLLGVDTADNHIAKIAPNGAVSVVSLN